MLARCPLVLSPVPGCVAVVAAAGEEDAVEPAAAVVDVSELFAPVGLVLSEWPGSALATLPLTSWAPSLAFCVLLSG